MSGHSEVPPPSDVIASTTAQSQDNLSSTVPYAASVVTEISRDIFTAPDGSALIHACNCKGVWGAGIASEFRDQYPAAYEIYRSHCQQHAENRQTYLIMDIDSHSENNTVEVRRPLGTALIILPQQSDMTIHGRRHWIVCLFTSHGYGRHAMSREMILNATWSALHDMQRKVYQINQHDGPGGQIQGLHACRFNSGLFGVPWARTRRLIDQMSIRMVVHAPGRMAYASRRGVCGSMRGGVRRGRRGRRGQSTGHN
ncbi:hypothetical protein PENANT_c022G06098 [Penicillium antarcticum]|uniref:Uncharacterized protein n=1 Tax=Penicillium antarcticum TaxID=416450 RepID=A0A1V6PZD5_9EURO|nr:uncharacterized protein N7508_002833 [Penicillium antarcticum]KAJ5312003.1 hypothetical protein N7508_002833 [Penicillium antarcticum]OQD82359.1 hypothetical protein PENANT_c022G06098 [Penicillium antarcticum]